jgi:hypothetical protein
MITGIAFCPHPPLLLPEIAAGAAAETADLRAACDAAIERMLATRPAHVVVIGARDRSDHHAGLRGFAPNVQTLPDDDLPLSLAIGSWLLGRAREVPTRQHVVVRPDGTPTTPWPDLSAATGLLVMGDGSARRSVKGPGYLDDRAQPFDARVVKAFAEADVAALANLDATLCAELLVAGVGAWKAVASLVGDQPWSADVLYDAAPYGVQYTVASWTTP